MPKHGIAVAQQRRSEQKLGCA